MRRIGRGARGSTESTRCRARHVRQEGIRPLCRPGTQANGPPATVRRARNSDPRSSNARPRLIEQHGPPRLPLSTNRRPLGSTLPHLRFADGPKPRPLACASIRGQPLPHIPAGHPRVSSHPCRQPRPAGRSSKRFFPSIGALRGYPPRTVWSVPFRQQRSTFTPIASGSSLAGKGHQGFNGHRSAPSNPRRSNPTSRRFDPPLAVRETGWPTFLPSAGMGRPLRPGPASPSLPPPIELSDLPCSPTTKSPPTVGPGPAGAGSLSSRRRVSGSWTNRPFRIVTPSPAFAPSLLVASSVPDGSSGNRPLPRRQARQDVDKRPGLPSCPARLLPAHGRARRLRALRYGDDGRQRFSNAFLCLLRHQAPIRGLGRLAVLGEGPSLRTEGPGWLITSPSFAPERQRRTVPHRRAGPAPTRPGFPNCPELGHVRGRVPSRPTQVRRIGSECGSPGHHE